MGPQHSIARVKHVIRAILYKSEGSQRSVNRVWLGLVGLDVGAHGGRLPRTLGHHIVQFCVALVVGKRRASLSQAM